ncbi:MAG: Nif11-like leader peptide family RiPP precursor [Anaerolineae bacterium]|nr:Nif11-like leader peptide family RiPP precursor [Anaerolineae bacterium]
MSAEAFLQKANEDEALRAKIEELEGDFTAIVKLGKEQGFEFTAAEFEAAYDAANELSDDDLASAAGGLGVIKPPPPEFD